MFYLGHGGAQINFESCLNGVYYEMNISENIDENDPVRYRVLSSGNEMVIVVDTVTKVVIKHYFQCYSAYSDRVDVNSVDEMLNCLTHQTMQSYVSGDCETDEITLYRWNGFVRYRRINSIPYLVFEFIKSIADELGLDLFELYMKRNIRAVCVDNLGAYLDPSEAVVDNIELHELVEILHVYSDWAYVRLIRTGKEYWVYMSCLD